MPARCRPAESPHRGAATINRPTATEGPTREKCRWIMSARQARVRVGPARRAPRSSMVARSTDRSSSVRAIQSVRSSAHWRASASQRASAIVAAATRRRRRSSGASRTSTFRTRGGRRCLSGVGNAGGHGTEVPPPVHMPALQTVERHAVAGETGREPGGEVRGEQLLHQLAARGGLMIDVDAPRRRGRGLVVESGGRVGHCAFQCCSAHECSFVRCGMSVGVAPEWASR